MTDLTLEERIGRLESQNRSMERRLGGAVVGFMIIVMAVGFVLPEIRERLEKREPTIFVEGRHFIVLNKEGKTRAELTDWGQGGMLTLRDSHHNERVFLGLDKNGEPGLWMADENGKWRCGLSVSDKGPELKLVDENGKALFSAP